MGGVRVMLRSLSDGIFWEWRGLGCLSCGLAGCWGVCFAELDGLLSSV